jgi:hypothetical protein
MIIHLGVNSRELGGGKDKSKIGQNKSNNSSGKENEKQNQNQNDNENAIIPYGKKDMKCYVDAYICDESNDMDRGSKARYELFMECYSNVDAVGFLIREKEKEKNAEKEKDKEKEKNKSKEKEKDKQNEKDIEKEKEKEKERERERERGSSASAEDSAMCYGEVEYISFQEVSLSHNNYPRYLFNLPFFPSSLLLVARNFLNCFLSTSRCLVVPFFFFLSTFFLRFLFDFPSSSFPPFLLFFLFISTFSSFFFLFFFSTFSSFLSLLLFHFLTITTSFFRFQPSFLHFFLFYSLPFLPFFLVLIFTFSFFSFPLLLSRHFPSSFPYLPLLHFN